MKGSEGRKKIGNAKGREILRDKKEEKESHERGREILRDKKEEKREE